MNSFVDINLEEFKQLQELAKKAGIDAFNYKGVKFKTDHAEMLIDHYE